MDNMKAAFVDKTKPQQRTCCLYLHRARERDKRIATVTSGAHAILFCISIMNLDCACHGSYCKDIKKSLSWINSGFHNIFLDQTLYYFPAVLVSSSAEDKGGEKKKVGGRGGSEGGIATRVLLPLLASELHGD